MFRIACRRLALAVSVLGLALTVPILAQSTLTVCASGCDYNNSQLQTALNDAALGDTITLEAGVTYTGSFTLPDKGAGTSFITIKSNASAGNLPGSGVRTSPAYAEFLPKIKSNGSGNPAMVTAAGAHHYRLENLEFVANPQGIYDILVLGWSDSRQQFVSQQPDDIIVDRVLMRGDPIYGMTRGIALHGGDIQIINSYISGMAGLGQDAQAIACGNGTGPYLIQNNYLEGAGENVICGGSDPWMRTRMTVTGSASTTGAAVQTVEANHTCNELGVGYPLAVETTSGVLETAITSISSISSNTCTLGWTAVATAPSVGHRVRWDSVPSDIQIVGNHIAKPTAWQNSILTKPTTLAGTPSTASGTLAAGTYCYRVQAYAIGGGHQGADVRSDVSDEYCTALSATGKVDLTWADISGETTWRVWRFTTSGATSGVWFTASSNSASDDGSKTTTTGSYSHGSRWTVKTVLEFKVGTNIVVRGNVLEYTWTGQGADGGLMWWKAVNQDGGCWTCRTWTALVEENIIRSGPGWLLVSGRESYSGNPRPFGLRDLTIQNNLIYDSNPTWGGNSWNILSNAAQNLIIDHNTLIHTGHSTIIFGDDTAAGLFTGFQFKNNLALRGTFGVWGSIVGEGTTGLNTYAPSALFLNNVIAGANCSIYPATTLCPSVAAFQAEFEAYSAGRDGGNFALKATSAYKLAGSDGLDIGADIAAVLAETANAIVGVSTSPPAIQTTSLPNKLISTAYGNQTVTAVGGTTPYTWSISAGALPTGLSIASGTGIISGTPSAAGAFTFTVKVVDNAAAEDTQEFTVTIYAAVAISTTSPLPDGTIDSAYSQDITVTGDLEPYTCAVTAGALPTGTTLTATSTGCRIAGTPTASGSPTVQVTGALGSQASREFVITVVSNTAAFNVANPTRSLRQNGAQARTYGGSSAPTCADEPWWFDVWADNSTRPATMKQPTTITCVAGVGSVTWSPIFATGSTTPTGDGSMLTELQAAELKGTLPTAVFPSDLSIGSSVTVPLLNLGQYLAFTAIPCLTLSTAGTSILCVDAATNELKVSSNGGPYTALGGSSSTALTSTVGDQSTMAFTLTTSQDVSSDSFSLGVATTNSRKAWFESRQGTLQQAMVFADASAATSTVWGVATSSDSGSTWSKALTVLQNLEVGAHAALSLTADITPAQITGDQNNYAPTGLLTATRVRLSSDASRTITGLLAGTDGQRILLVNAGGQAIVLASAHTSSTEANRFICPGNANFTLDSGDSVWVHYDATSSRWRVEGF